MPAGHDAYEAILAREFHYQKLIGALIEGQRHSVGLLQGFVNRIYDFKRIDEGFSQIPDETVRHAAELFLFSSAIVELSRSPNKKGARPNDSVLRFNHALREIILDADGSPLTTDQLIGGLVGFAQRNLLIRHDERESYREELKPTFEGAWCEQSAVNYFCAAEIGNYDATMEQDRKGTDEFMTISDKADGLWVPIDIKSSERGIRRYAKDKDLYGSHQIHKFSATGEINNNGQSVQASPESPIILVLPFRGEKFLLAIDYGLHGNVSPYVASLRFDSHNTAAIQAMRNAHDFISTSALKEKYQTYTRAHTKSGDRFLPLRMPKRIGSVAIQ